MKRLIAVLGVVILLAGAAAAAAQSMDDFRIASEGDALLPFITDFSGFTSDISFNTSNSCFSAVEDTNFNWGDRISFNSFFVDTSSGGIQIYDVTMAIKFKKKVRVLYTRPAVFNLTAFPAGTQLRFCTADWITTPNKRNPLSIVWGKAIRRRGTGQTVRGVLGSFNIQ